MIYYRLYTKDTIVVYIYGFPQLPIPGINFLYIHISENPMKVGTDKNRVGVSKVYKSLNK
ncbi:hypothetical protein C7972_112105 [Arenibacter sp. ARW7G5Y1]|nr:hypothetical protein C7972_112105 [Arenibacter sp. ARW7G5Y1]